ncbi:MAG: ClpXP protease specificity-enhancing factor [Hydrocarboniphaga sp.]|uniref:ClpXP protease specificity-enhancing factor n=1 Tax=Hydrocarboniphaga sp. TaxID=2033016 RepID=UPI00260C4616|nr:ClpXP protease specificity-enhancing factor [Hydrocarboniphaga sp.]MDB5969579.1 ClpXP protease specificity-enhancing factor [Hydrocarboniphaga sp.]
MPSSRSRRPYLIRAIYDWATDNGYTPHLLVAADYEGVVVPREFVQEGRITLNVSGMAVQALDMSSDPIWFSARFSGRSFDVQVPSGAVLAVFARENGEGIVFGEVEPPTPPDGKPKSDGNDGAPKTPPPRPSGRPNLRVVK